MSTRLLAVVLALVSLVAAAWFAFGIRQAHDTAAADAILAAGSTPTAAQTAHAFSLLRTAKQLNPDTQVDLLRAQLLLDQGNRRAARSVLERVVATEPDNALAWEWLARASVGDTVEFFRAVLRFEQLVPPIHRGR